ncbi:hypothetical protein ACS3SW_19590 [Roseobacteraceae bacterium S113]
MSFASLTLPEHLLRPSALKPKYRPDGYLDALDRETLWYDAIWDAGRLYLVCPPLRGLRKHIRRARFRGDGAPLSFKRVRRYKRHDVVELKAETCPRQLTVYLGDWRGESAVNAADHARFSGKNTLFYVSQNNDLHWIVDHARFHQHHHGLEALIVMDNASTAYGAADIETALAPLGLDVLVLEAPFKYGPVGLPPYRRLEKFMQTALFNVLRLRYLAACRAVLSVDIDELVIGPGSVFDAVCAGTLGFAQIKGAWALPAPGSAGPYTHGDHTFVANPPEICPPKWCMSPRSKLWGWSWDVHGIERLPLLHGRTLEGFRFAHCRAVTTGWKKQKRLLAPEGAVEDAQVRAALGAAGLLRPS